MTINEFEIEADRYVEKKNYKFKAGVIPFENELREYMRSIIMNNEYDSQNPDPAKVKELINQTDDLLNKYIKERTKKYYE